MPWAYSFYKKLEQKRCILSLHSVYSNCFVGIIIHVICSGILIKVLVQMQETSKMALSFQTVALLDILIEKEKQKCRPGKGKWKLAAPVPCLPGLLCPSQCLTGIRQGIVAPSPIDVSPVPCCPPLWQDAHSYRSCKDPDPVSREHQGACHSTSARSREALLQSQLDLCILPFQRQGSNEFWLSSRLTQSSPLFPLGG